MPLLHAAPEPERTPDELACTHCVEPLMAVSVREENAPAAGVVPPMAGGEARETEVSVLPLLESSVPAVKPLVGVEALINVTVEVMAVSTPPLTVMVELSGLAQPSSDEVAVTQLTVFTVPIGAQARAEPQTMSPNIPPKEVTPPAPVVFGATLMM